jgi:thioredoxin reductase (NADPH)
MKLTASTDVAIIGAGPTGLELAVALTTAAIPFLIFDAGQIGHTISWWPRHQRFFSTSERIAMPGLPFQIFDQQHPTGDEYLAYLRAVVEQYNLKINTFEPVNRIWKEGQQFYLHSLSMKGDRLYSAKQVVLATGGMAGPNLLDIPGEELPHVSHYLDDPHYYFRKDLLVIGGHNSAVEYALRCWRSGARVTLSYRKTEIPKTTIKPALMQDLETVIRENKIRFLPSTMPVEITHEEVVLAATAANGQSLKKRHLHVPVDFVLICSGYQADMTLFEQLGVILNGSDQVPEFNPDTMETNIAGVYVLGTAAGGSQHKYTHFIETSHIHVPKILAAIQRPSS